LEAPSALSLIGLHKGASSKHSIAALKRLKQATGSPILGIEFCAPVAFSEFKIFLGCVHPCQPEAANKVPKE
jgi:hypothetical protein